MPPPLLIDLDGIDLDQRCLNREQIYEYLPHRHEFMLLDGICWVEREAQQIISYRDVSDADWWARGHVPNWPIFPGALMLEMAGQTTALLAKLTQDKLKDVFVGFGGVEACKFRESVQPPARLHVLAKLVEVRSRRITGKTQGVANGRLIFEASITGLALR